MIPSTTVTVPNGGTLFFAGYSEVEHRDGTAGLPFVEHLPLLRFLFRRINRAKGRRSLFMLITAETVPDIFEE